MRVTSFRSQRDLPVYNSMSVSTLRHRIRTAGRIADAGSVHRKHVTSPFQGTYSQFEEEDELIE